MSKIFAGIVPVGPDGYPAPDLASPPVKVHIGDICLTPSSERTAYTEWIRTGDAWVQVGDTLSTESEVDTLKKQRVNSVRDYFNRRKNAVNEIEQFMLAEMC